MSRFRSPITPETYDPQWMTEQFNALQEAIQSVEQILFQEVNREDIRPRNGLLVFADGTNWNPGGGRGLYFYDGDTASWNLLTGTKTTGANPLAATLTIQGFVPTVS